MKSTEQQLMFELFEGTPRQGPGSVETTRRALSLVPSDLKIARVLDLGCGTGGSTLVLAQSILADVVAVDIHAPFLETLRVNAERFGGSDRIETRVADMAEIESIGGDFDLIWAEGSAYSIGFENALRRWRELLRPAGCLVVSELVWFVDEPSDEPRGFFASEYPEMRTEAFRLAQAVGLGYELIDSFRLPESDWHAYYAGVGQSLKDAVARRGDHPVYASMRQEAALYEEFGGEYGYVCLVMRNRSK